jgi:hypothetical protein
MLKDKNLIRSKMTKPHRGNFHQVPCEDRCWNYSYKRTCPYFRKYKGNQFCLIPL